jgi:hypothetical protein
MPLESSTRPNTQIHQYTKLNPTPHAESDHQLRIQFEGNRVTVVIVVGVMELKELFCGGLMTLH